MVNSKLNLKLNPKLNLELNKVQRETYGLLDLAYPYLKKANADRWHHTLRVLKFAEHLAKIEKADMEVVRFAAILHDVGKYKEPRENHALAGWKIASRILKKFVLPKKKKENILHCILVHSWESHGKAKTKEAKIIQDADRLDRVSPTRVALHLYFAQKSKKDILSAVKSVERIIKETSVFNTNSASQIAESRIKASSQFIKLFEEDYIIK